MVGNFAVCYKITRVWEGGDVNHPKDPGGLTSRGVTQRTGAAYRKRKGLPPKSVTAWTEGEVHAFYRSEFWYPIMGDNLPKGVDLSVYDFGVNSGTRRSVQHIQRIVGVKPDGVVGTQETLPAIREFMTKFGAAELIKRHCASRLGFLQSLNIWKTFGKGWGRRVADIRANALAMVLTQEELVAEAKKSEITANKSVTTGAASGTVGVGGGAVVDTVTGTDWALIASLGLFVVIVTAAFIFAVTRVQQSDAIIKVATKET